MEHPNHGGVQDVPMGDPAAFFQTVLLPVHQVLEAPAWAIYVQQPVDREGQVVIDDAGWWWGSS